MIIGPIFNKTDMALLDCLVHGPNQVIVIGDGGTGCDCGGLENDAHITLMTATPIDTMLIEPLQEYVKNQAKFCKRCGQAHKTSWCK